GVGGLDRGRDPAFGSIGVGRRGTSFQAIEQHATAVATTNAGRKHGHEPGEGWIAKGKIGHGENRTNDQSLDVVLVLASSGKLALPGICSFSWTMASCQSPGVSQLVRAPVLCLLTLLPSMSDRLSAEQSPPALVNLA